MFNVQCSKFEFILYFGSGKGEEWSRELAFCYLCKYLVIK